MLSGRRLSRIMLLPAYVFFFYIVQIILPHRAVSENYLAANIPLDWQDYITSDLLDIQNLPLDGDRNLFQGDIAGISIQQQESFDFNQDDGIQKPQVWLSRLIPYEFSPYLRNSDRDLIQKAFNEIESQTCIRFIRRTYEQDYLQLVGGKRCFSFVGRQTGSQVLAVGQNCAKTSGYIIHIVLHALGYYHESSRSDRDNYVWINNKNLPKDSYTRVQFSKNNLVPLNLPYDYSSIMHYPWNAYGVNRYYPTILPKVPHQPVGQRIQLSAVDIMRVNQLYKCSNQSVKASALPNTTIALVNRALADGITDWSILCDGKQDTPGGWDELPDACLKVCEQLDGEMFGGKSLLNLPDTFQCIHKDSLCNGISNTFLNASDCQKYCREGGYVPVGPTSQCVHFSKLCNGVPDTMDGSDEIADNCQFLCQSSIHGFEGQLFNLPSGQCMMKRGLCDGTQRTEGDVMADPNTCRVYCKESGYFPTPDTAQCIHWTNLCDGYEDTVNGWDEDTANCNEYCPKVFGYRGDLVVMPGSGQCMHKRWLCNGVDNTMYDPSENLQVCQGLCNGNLYFPTPDTQQCIRATDLCDGKADTVNAWDEVKRNCVKYCKFQNTAKNLVVNPKSKRCIQIAERVLDLSETML